MTHVIFDTPQAEKMSVTAMSMVPGTPYLFVQYIHCPFFLGTDKRLPAFHFLRIDRIFVKIQGALFFNFHRGTEACPNFPS